EPVVGGFDHLLRRTGEIGLDEPDPSTDAGIMPAHTVIDRPLLRRILLSGLGDIVHFGRRCVGYDADADTVTARFADGSSVHGTVLVAADGIGSVIRPQRLPGAQIVDTRARLVYGRVPLTSDLRRALPPEMISVFNSVSGPDKRFVGIAPVHYRRPPVAVAARLAPEVAVEPTEDTLAVMFGRRLDQLGLSDRQLHAASGLRLRELVLEHLSGWHPLVTRIIAEWTPSSIYPIAVRSSVPVPPWPTSNITLLGDAIHAMSPAAGAGANIALRDAAALAATLTEAAAGRSLHAALREYERAMSEEGFRAVRLSAVNGAQTLGADPLPR
ncbi:MAG: FAD-dependent oxidoreductase, partial [Stackebrandtia sp.]